MMQQSKNAATTTATAMMTRTSRNIKKLNNATIKNCSDDNDNDSRARAQRVEEGDCSPRRLLCQQLKINNNKQQERGEEATSVEMREERAAAPAALGESCCQEDEIYSEVNGQFFRREKEKYHHSDNVNDGA